MPLTSSGLKVFTQLMKAAAKGSASEVESLLQNPDHFQTLFDRDHRGRTAKDWARREGHLQAGDLLQKAMLKELDRRNVKQDANTTERAMTDLVSQNARLGRVLDHAVTERDVEAVSLAVESATFTRAEFEEACRELFVFAEAALEKSKMEGRGASTQSAFTRTEVEHTSEKYYLDTETETGGTALLLACAADDVRLCQAILEKGGVVDLENQRGHTALTWACVCGSAQVATVLLQSGKTSADFRTKLEGRTPLLHAAHHGQAKCVQVLVDRLFLEAQQCRFEGLRFDRPRPLPELEQDVLRRNWMRQFTKSLFYTDPWSGLRASALARSRGHEDAFRVLDAAESRCQAREAELSLRAAQVARVFCPRKCQPEEAKNAMPLDSLTAHMLNDCALRPAGCDLCGSTLPLGHLEDHQSTTCAQRQVWCSLCRTNVAARIWDAHARFRCPQRSVACRQGCGMILKADTISVHEMQKCPLRPKPCPNVPSCGFEVAANRVKVHATTECEMRLVKCRLGCGKLVAFAKLDFHETQVWAHADLMCLLRTTSCPYGCAWRGGYQDLESHLDAELGSCEERLMRCRYDLLGRRVEYEVQGTEKGSIYEMTFEHATLRKYDSEKDSFYVYPQQGKPFWAKINELHNVVFVDAQPSSYKCDWVSAASMAAHLSGDCVCKPARTLVFEQVEETIVAAFEEEFEAPEIEIRCKYGCGLAFDSPNDDDLRFAHQIGKCPKRCVVCHGCGDGTIWAEELEGHILNDCPVLSVKPPPSGSVCRCGLFVAHADATDHQLECDGKDVYCPSGCGEKMLLRDVERHASKCQRRHLQHGVLVSCPLGCGRDGIRFQDEWAHVSSECPRRIVECDFGCGAEIPHNVSVDHANVCDLRVVPCGVGAEGCERQKRSNDDRSLALSELSAEAIDGHSAMTKASELDDLDMVERLWRAGVDVNGETKRGRTPLIEASKAGSSNVAKFLVLKGAVVDLKARQGRNALEWARMSGQMSVYTQLRRDLDVASDMSSLFKLVSLHDYDAVLNVVKEGEPFQRCALPILLNELQVEDQALQDCLKDEIELQRLSRQFKISRLESDHFLDQKVELAAGSQGSADAAFKVRNALDESVDVSLRKAAIALRTVEDADVVELHSLAARAVPLRVLSVLKACCLLLDLSTKKAGEAAFASNETVKRTGRGVDAGRDAANEWRGAKKCLAKPTELVRTLRFFSTANNKHFRGAAQHLRELFAEQADEGAAEEVPPAPPASSRLHWSAADLERARLDRLACDDIDRESARARSVGRRKPLFSIDQDADNADRPAIGGYQLAGVLALWVNAHVAAMEASDVLRGLEQAELVLRNTFTAERAPMLNAARRDNRVAHSRCEMLDAELAACQKSVLYLRKRCRVARVSQTYTPSGHSLLTWACSLGAARIAECLLDHGSAPALPDAVEAAAAEVAQFVFRHFQWRKGVQERLKTAAPSAADTAEGRLKEAAFSFARTRLLQQFSDARAAHRVPLCEAAYNKHDVIFDAFDRRKKLHFGHRGALECFKRPQAPFPYKPRPESQRSYSVLECSNLGATEIGAAFWDYGTSWVGESDSAAPQSRAFVWAERCWLSHLRRVADGNTLRQKQKETRVAKQRLKAAILELEQAVRNRDFMRVSQIFDQAVVPVDHESQNHLTALIAASTEDTEMEERVGKCFDVEGVGCLAVELLLDRQQRRPMIDYENGKGHTALSFAAEKGRVAVCEALLHRGAALDRQSEKTGKTALRYAAENDRYKAVELFLALGANADSAPKDGSTALDAARAEGHVATQALLAKQKRFSLGPAAYDRGVADVLKPCRNGCGDFTSAVTAARHELEDCRKRRVVCGYCGDSELWAEELSKHERLDCTVARVVKCPLDCGAQVRVCDVSKHCAGECKNRCVPCLECGADVLYCRFAEHQRSFCPARIVAPKIVKARQVVLRCEFCGCCVNQDALKPESHNCPVFRATDCPNGCGEKPKQHDMLEHLDACMHRWVECPRSCGVKVRQIDLQSHVDGPAAFEARCTKGVEQCPKCLRSVAVEEFEVHSLHVCPSRSVDCGLCGLAVEAKALRSHKESGCAYATVACPNFGCWKRLAQRDMDVYGRAHARRTCRKRLVVCQRGCGLKMPLKRHEAHVLEKCDYRYIVQLRRQIELEDPLARWAAARGCARATSGITWNGDSAPVDSAPADAVGSPSADAAPADAAPADAAPADAMPADARPAAAGADKPAADGR
ncbi:hypothetical protein M885DRAFT_497423 [Pelagophyceae sp. CCMP2097]|nr:hypothetical protein M885DRAFT_497423 [Pelagophyceae sp. CCMP2097]